MDVISGRGKSQTHPHAGGSKVILGQDGKVYVKRADGTIDSQTGGEVLRQDGQRLKLGPREKLIVGADGRVYVQRADGTVVDARTGKAVLGVDGQPIVVPP